MQIKTEKPPIWEEAHKHFDIDDEHTVFTYGDTLYNPAGVPISMSLLEHEATHSLQQEDYESPREWWDKYFIDKEFRLKQELAAYKMQYYNFCKEQKDRNVQAKYAARLAKDLSSPMYGNIIELSVAYELIRK